MVKQEILNKYASCMEEIKKRKAVVEAFLDERSNTLYPQTTAESICLQVRKILELIALSSLIANKDAYAKIREDFKKDWHARYILKDVESINPNFYPEPQRPETSSQPIPLTSGFLTKEKFEQLYNRCGGMMHAKNPFSAPNKEELGDFFRLLPSWMSEITKLLNFHIVQLAQDNFKLFVQMHAKPDLSVSVTLFTKIQSE